MPKLFLELIFAIQWRIGATENALGYIWSNLPIRLHTQYFIHSIVIHSTKGISIATCHIIVFLKCASFQSGTNFFGGGVAQSYNSGPRRQKQYSSSSAFSWGTVQSFRSDCSNIVKPNVCRLDARGRMLGWGVTVFFITQLPTFDNNFSSNLVDLYQVFFYCFSECIVNLLCKFLCLECGVRLF